MLQRIFSGPLAVIYIGVGLWGFFLVAQYVLNTFGTIALIVGIFLFPVLYSLVPLYAGFVDQYWLPAMVSYAPILLAIIVSEVGALLSKE